MTPAPVQGADERLRRARLTTAANATAHVVALAVGLVSVPLTVGYLGNERYGVWVTLSSLLTWLSVADLGLGGNALVNVLAEAHGRQDRNLARELVATAFWILTAIATAVVACAVVAAPHIPWRIVFNVSTSVSEAELVSALLLALACFGLSFPANVVQAVFAGYQEGYLGSIFNMVASLTSLLALLLVVRTHGGLPTLVLGLYGARLAVTAMSAAVLFGALRPWLRPAPAAATRSAARRLLTLGSHYVLAQLAGIGMFQSQPIIVARALGPEAVGVFAVAQRLLTLPLLLVQFLTTPLMPAYGEARARNDWTWIRSTLRGSVVNAAAVGLGLVLPLALAARSIVSFWVGPTLAPDVGLVAGLGVYCGIAALVTPLSVLLYGIERVRWQAGIAGVNAAVTVAGALWLTPSLGLTGTAVAMAVGMLFVNGVGQLAELRRALPTRPQSRADAGL